ncbi:MAG: hypothetical protein ACLQRH_14100 [Acidimicrobiales bacterium]
METARFEESMSTVAKLVTVDNRQRVSLGKLADREHYLLSKEPDGRIVLTPAVVTPEILEYPEELRESIVKSLKEPKTWARRRDLAG